MLAWLPNEATGSLEQVFVGLQLCLGIFGFQDGWRNKQAETLNSALVLHSGLLSFHGLSRSLGEELC